MKKIVIAVALLLPAMAMAQQKYTNADLDIAPKRDAYTNEDLKGLAPLTVSGPVMAEAMAAVPVDRAAEMLAGRKADLLFDRDMIEAEIGYQREMV